jgi:hypothetical protein
MGSTQRQAADGANMYSPASAMTTTSRTALTVDDFFWPLGMTCN